MFCCTRNSTNAQQSIEKNNFGGVKQCIQSSWSLVILKTDGYKKQKFNVLYCRDSLEVTQADEHWSPRVCVRPIEKNKTDGFINLQCFANGAKHHVTTL